MGVLMVPGAMVFTRTRYTVAIYLVTFGYVIVAAYKMGMVHERPRVVRDAAIERIVTGRRENHHRAREQILVVVGAHQRRASLGDPSGELWGRIDRHDLNRGTRLAQ